MNLRFHGLSKVIIRLLFKFILPIIIISYLLNIFCTHFFKIQSIEVIGNDIQIEFDTKIINQNLLFFPSEHYRNQIMHDYPQIESVIFHKKYPSTLQLSINMREAFACVEMDHIIYVIDEKGYIIGFDINKCQNLPSIIIPKTANSNFIRINNPLVDHILPLIKALSSEISIQNVSFEEGGIIRIVFDKTSIIISQDQDINSLVSTLQTLIRGVRMKGIMPRSIDLRFTKPIIIN
jgi:cell division septal protein FtsQ